MARRPAAARGVRPLEELEPGWLESVLPNPAPDLLDEKATAPDGTEIRGWEAYVLWALNPRDRSSVRPSQTEDLTKMEGHILRRRLELDGAKASLDSVGSEVLLSREQVRRIEAMAVGKVMARALREGRAPTTAEDG